MSTQSYSSVVLTSTIEWCEPCKRPLIDKQGHVSEGTESSIQASHSKSSLQLESLHSLSPFSSRLCTAQVRRPSRPESIVAESVCCLEEEQFCCIPELRKLHVIESVQTRDCSLRSEALLSVQFRASILRTISRSYPFPRKWVPHWNQQIWRSLVSMDSTSIENDDGQRKTRICDAAWVPWAKHHAESSSQHIYG